MVCVVLTVLNAGYAEFSCVDLSSNYTSERCVDANGNLFPPDVFFETGKFTAKTYEWGEIPFSVSAANAQKLMSCSGQEYDLPKSDCTVLYILGFAVDGFADGKIDFIFSDGTNSPAEYRMMSFDEDVEYFESAEYSLREAAEYAFNSSKKDNISPSITIDKTTASLYINRIIIPRLQGKLPEKMRMLPNQRIRIAGMTFSSEKINDGDVSVAKSAPPKPAEIAIFAEPKFPYYRMVGVFSPEYMQQQLQEAGISSCLLTQAEINSEKIFNNQNYKALLLLYGNTFPVDCFDAIKNFKKNGGILCTTGVPFTHPVRDKKSLGHSDKYFQELGLAGFKSAADRLLCPTPLVKTIGLDHIDWRSMELNDSQAMDVSRLPANTVKDMFLTTAGDMFAGVVYYPDEKSAELRLQVSQIGNPYSADEKLVQARLMVSMIAYALDKYAQRPDANATEYVKALYSANKKIKLDDAVAEKDLPKPVFLENRTDRICPSANKKVKEYLVFDVSRMSLAKRNLFISAQGLINSASNDTMLYLLHRNHDTFWLEWMTENGYIDSYRKIESGRELLKTFGLNKAILLDPKISASLNIATTLAGIKGLLIANDNRIVEEFGLEVVEDFRGRWKTNVEAYKWLLDNYWDKIDKTVLAFIDSSSHVSLPRDYLVANKVFTFWISGPVDSSRPGADQQAEYQYISDVLAKFPVNIPVLGFPYHGFGIGIGEPGGLPLLSAYGKFLVPSDYVSNMSVFTNFPVFKTDKPATGSRDVQLENDKVYVSLVMSDGDNICTWNDFFHNFWKRMGNRNFPVGWPMSPCLGDMNPVQAAYFYKVKKDIDSLGSAVSGVGYIFGKDYARKFGSRRQAVLDEFHSLTEKYMTRMGFSWLHIMGSGGSGSPVTGEYTKGLKKLDAMVVGYGKEIGVVDYATSNEYSNGVPVFYVVSSGGTQIKNRINDVNAVLPAERKGPVFAAVIIINWDSSPQDLSDFENKLPDNWVLVTPEQLGKLYRQALK